MKELLLLCLATMLLGQQVFAAWAAHLIISPASLVRDPKGAAGDRFIAEAAQLARGVTVRPAGKGRVSIVLRATEDKGEMGKGYYLMVSKKRLAPDALQLRSALGSTNRLILSGGGGTRKTVPEGFVEVRPLQPFRRNGDSVVEVVLDREVALRSYVVWDFRAFYEQPGAIIMDGGLWLTYDLPAFVEGLDAAEKKPK